MSSNSHQPQDFSSASAASIYTIAEERKYRTYESIQSYLTWYYEIKNIEKRREYHIFNTMKKSGGSFIFAAAFLFTFALFPVQFAWTWSDLCKIENTEEFMKRVISSSIATITSGISAYLGWNIYLYHVPRKQSIYQYTPTCIRVLISSCCTCWQTLSTSSSTNDHLPADHLIFSPENSFRELRSGSISQNRRNRYFGICQFLKTEWNIELSFLCSSQLYFSIIFLRRAMSLNCINPNNSIAKIFGAGECFEGTALTQTILIYALFMITIPMIFAINLPNANIKIAWMNLICSFLLALIVSGIRGQLRAVPLLLIWFMLCMFTIIDVEIQNLINYFTTMDLNEALLEVKRMEEENHKNEMRSMIANVAHDLKTPLTSFITGIDFIQHIVNDVRSEVMKNWMEGLGLLLDPIQQCLHTIRNTNSFMLMTINRCIDYTKASKGMKLVPRYETIHLEDALQLPLNCVKSIQSRIEIIMKDIPSDICSHLITDKQWLQENLLCLLSNAVKYSNEGTVTITIKKIEDTALVFRKNISKPHFVISTNALDRKNQKDDRKNQEEKRDTPITRQISKGTSASKVIPLANNSSSYSDDDSERREQQNSALFANFDYTREYILFEIEDTGIGISDQAMKSLFAPFKQTQRLAGGTGLGLFSLARRLEALCGYYGVQHRKDGKQGSLFWFAIPYRPDELSAAMIMTKHTNSTSSKDEVSQSKVPPEASKVSMEAVPSIVSPRNLPLPQKSGLELDILIVDDSPAIVKMTTMILKKLGHQVSSAENGEIAVRMIQERWESVQTQYDVVLMDLQMPVMDGLEATRRIRQYENDLEIQNKSPEELNLNNQVVEFHRFTHQIIIGMSANSDHETSQEALVAGVDTFIGKPFNVNTFSEILHKLIKNQDTESNKKQKVEQFETSTVNE